MENAFPATLLRFNTAFNVRQALHKASLAKLIEPIGSGNDYSFIHQELLESLKAIAGGDELVEYHQAFVELAKRCWNLQGHQPSLMCAQHQVSLIKLGVIREDAVDDLLRAAKTTFAENPLSDSILRDLLQVTGTTTAW